MSIAPVTAQVEVRQPPENAFRLFSERMLDWWKIGTVGANPAVSVTIEPAAGGRWYETDADGNDTPWGYVIAWEPPLRLLLAWQLTSQFQFDPNLVTEVEITFSPTAAGGTRVALEHRNLERFGSDAAKTASSLGGGWATLLNTFAQLADSQGATS